MIRTFAIVVVLGASGIATAAQADSGEWRVTESTGQVQILHAGLSRVATRGGTLQSGDTLVTGKAARAVVVRGEDYLVVAPNSRFRIAPPAPSSNFVQILEDWGNVVFKIKKTGVPHFGVQTPYLAAVVKGTTFSITVTEKGSSVQVIEGAVQVSTLNGGATELVRPGMIALVSGANLHSLDVQGEGTRGSGAPAPASPDASDAGSDKASADGESITAAIGDDGSNLGEATNGLVTGSAAPVALLASALSARGDAGIPSALPDSPSVGGASAGEMPPVAVDAGMPSDGVAGEGKPGPIDDKGGSAAGSDSSGSSGSDSNEGTGAGNGSSGDGSGTGTDNSGSGQGDNHGNDHSGHGNGKGNSGNGNGNGGGDGAGSSGKGNGRGGSQNGNGSDGGKGSGKFK